MTRLERILHNAIPALAAAALFFGLMALTACGGPEPLPEVPVDTVEVPGDPIEVPPPPLECPEPEPCPSCPDPEPFAPTEADLETCLESLGLGFLLCPVL
jgi:hypothetical protein